MLLAKPHLVVIYFPFYILLDAMCFYFLKEFCVCIYEEYWSVIFLEFFLQFAPSLQLINFHHFLEKINFGERGAGESVCMCV